MRSISAQDASARGATWWAGGADRRAAPLGLVVGGCLAVAAASLPLARSLSFDAWGWLIWGREIVGGSPFTTAGYPTWKPLTGLLAIPLAPLGRAGPTLWLLLARFGAVLAVVLAYRLGRRAAGRVAGVLAAASLVLVPEWLFQSGVGGSEPLLTALLLAAVDRHADRDDTSGFVLVLLAALLRPESWPFLLASGAVTWRRRPALRPLLLAGLAAVPAAWFYGDYLGSGDPLTGGHLARMSREAYVLHHSAASPTLVTLEHGGWALPLVALAGVPAGLASAFRGRDPILLPLALGGLTWLAEVALLAGLGYAGVTRFLFPSAAALAVVGAAGCVTLVRTPRLGRSVRAALGVALAGLALVSAARVLELRHEAVRVERRADIEQSLDRLLARVGRARFLAAPNASGEGVELTGLAWRLDVPPGSLRNMRVPGLRVAMRDRHWRSFWRVVRSHPRLRARTIARDGALYVISVEPRRPVLAGRPEISRSEAPPERPDAG